MWMDAQCTIKFYTNICDGLGSVCVIYSPMTLPLLPTVWSALQALRFCSAEGHACICACHQCQDAWVMQARVGCGSNQWCLLSLWARTGGMSKRQRNPWGQAITGSRWYPREDDRSEVDQSRKEDHRRRHILACLRITSDLSGTHLSRASKRSLSPPPLESWMVGLLV